MSEWEIGLITAGIVLFMLILRVIAGDKHPLRGFLLSVLIGIGAMTIINLCSPFTGVSMPVSQLSLAVSALLGIPGITAMLLLQLLF